MGPSRFTSHQKEGVLRIFIALKNPSPWPGFEPEILGCCDEHTNLYTTEATEYKRYRCWGTVGSGVTSAQAYDAKITWESIGARMV
jgi:hypothetical protein